MTSCRVNYHALKGGGFLLHPSSADSSWFYAAGEFRSTGHIFYGLASGPAEVPEVFLPGYPTTIMVDCYTTDYIYMMEISNATNSRRFG
jgi:hypothetical protein